MTDRTDLPVGWEDHALEQGRRWARLAPLDRLRWLDEAKRFVLASRAFPRHRAADRPIRESEEPEP